MFNRNKNTPCINRCAQIYKFIKIFIYFIPWWPCVNDDVWHKHAFRFFNIIINDGLEYITTTFNTNTRNIYIYIYIVCVCGVHSCSIFTFLNNLQTIIQQSSKHCPIIIMGNFNVDILKDNNQPKKKHYYISWINSN